MVAAILNGRGRRGSSGHAIGMGIAVSYYPSREDVAPACLPWAGRLARVEVFDDMLGAEPFWRRLEDDGALKTSYQRFDLLAAWQHQVGARNGVTPCIVVGFDSAGEPLFLWPFGRSRVGLFRIVHFLGSKHANFNIGIWRRDVVASVSADDIRNVLGQMAPGGDAVDLVALFRQPLNWADVANPFALLPHQWSVDVGACQRIERPVISAARLLSSTMRSRLRTKENKLKKLPGYRYTRAATSAEVDRLLESFFKLKSVHMAARGVTNVFAEPGVAEFLREACHAALPGGYPVLELHALETDTEVLAVSGATIDDYRFSSMFNTYTLGEHGRHSPGLVLLRHMLGSCLERGSRSFDIGVGRAQYKSFFCKEREPLFDSFLALTARGHIAAFVFRMTFAAKRLVKEKPALWGAVQRLRRFRARRNGSSQAADLD